MSRAARTTYICQGCGAKSPRWAGQCSDCKQWNTLVEGRAEDAAPGVRGAVARGVAAAAAGVAFSRQQAANYAGATGGRGVQRLSEISAEDAPRVPTGLSEFDRVLGGGLVPGAVILIGGDPGIGKSTLLLQVMAGLLPSMPVLYVTGEESLQQVRLRAERLGLPALGLPVLPETTLETVLATLAAERPALAVIDSVQTLYTDAMESAPGSVAQLRECAAQLVRHAKITGTTIILVGHVTKEGTIAGPRVLEHMVDTVVYFEHDAGSRYRLVRAVKNRFGAVNELGVFAMTDAGLKEVSNPSAMFLSRHDTPVAGSVITVTRQGSRPLLVEVQSLVDSSPLGNPRRVTVGLETNRLAMLLAVLSRHAGVVMADQDVFANVVGGMRIQETAADLPLLASAVSSYRGRPVPADTVVFGEVGLAGEIRPVQAGEERLAEAAKHGFKRAVVPEANRPRKGGTGPGGIEVIGVARLEQALDALSG